MINQLHIFASASYVVADEWNANFKTISTSNGDCAQGINDANDVLAFPNSDLSGIKSAYQGTHNSFIISGNSVVMRVGCEYYKTLSSGEDLSITVPNINGEYRVIIKTPDDRDLDPVNIIYSGQVIKKYTTADYMKSGNKILFFWVSNNKCFVKMGEMV